MQSRNACVLNRHRKNAGRTTLKYFLAFADMPPLVRNSAWCSARVVKVHTSAVLVPSGVVSGKSFFVAVQ